MNILTNNQNLSKLELLLISQQTVYNLNDLCLLWSENDRNKVSDLAGWYVDQKKMFRLKSGIFSVIDPTNDQAYAQAGDHKTEYKYVISQKLVAPSYLSYHTILTKSGLNFQYYETVYAMALVNKQVTVNEQKYRFYKLDPIIFFNPIGITAAKSGQNVATPERAVVDTWYINSSLGLDNLGNLDHDLLQNLAQIYNKPRIWKNLKTIFGIDKKS